MGRDTAKLKGKGGKWKYVSPSPFVLHPSDFTPRRTACPYPQPTSPRKDIHSGLIFRRLLVLIRINTNTNTNISLVASSRGQYPNKSLPKAVLCAICITTVSSGLTSSILIHITNVGPQQIHVRARNARPGVKILSLPVRLRPPISAHLCHHSPTAKTDSPAGRCSCGICGESKMSILACCSSSLDTTSTWRSDKAIPVARRMMVSARVGRRCVSRIRLWCRDVLSLSGFCVDMGLRGKPGTVRVDAHAVGCRMGSDVGEVAVHGPICKTWAILQGIDRSARH
jgi:hypothetical protein